MHNEFVLFSDSDLYARGHDHSGLYTLEALLARRVSSIVFLFNAMGTERLIQIFFPTDLRLSGVPVFFCRIMHASWASAPCSIDLRTRFFFSVVLLRFRPL